MSWMKRHPLVAYFILAYAITWVLVFPLVASTQGLLDIQVSPIWHFTWNIVNIAAPVFEGDIAMVMSILLIVGAVAIVIVARPANLSRSGKHTI